MREAREYTVVTPIASIETVVALEPAAAEGRGVLIEAKLLWGRDMIGVRHVAARGDVCVRDLGLDLPEGADDLAIGERDEAGTFVLRLPNGTAVPAGCRMTLRMGRALLRLSLVPDDVVKLPRARPDARTAFGILAAAALHLVVLGLVAHGRDDGRVEDGSRETMQRLVASAEQRALAELAAAQEKTRAEMVLAPPAPMPAKEQAVAGNPSKTNPTIAQGRVTRGDVRRAAKAERAEREGASTFGLLSVLSSDAAGARAGSSAFAAETGPSAMGNIFGQLIDDAAGLGGLGLTGAGEGAGGHGAGVKLGSIGTIGCCGGVAPPRRAHDVRSPTMRWDDEGTMVSGRLPPEAVRRTVRASFGRLRACYEAGLLRNPDLEGRVSVKFVIGRDGEVALASPWADTTLPDLAVAQCVSKVYQGMTFPQPVNGIVTVVYPVVFTRTSP